MTATRAKDNGILLPGTTIAIDGQAVLLRGPMRCGKSELALRCMDRGAVLVSDSQIRVKNLDRHLGVQDASDIPGVIFIAGLGAVKTPTRATATLALVIDLVPRENMPAQQPMGKIDILGHAVPFFRLHAFDSAAVQKIYAALEIAKDPALLLS